jgi:hypothetical protein
LTAADALRSFPGSAIVQQGGVGLLRRLLLSEKGATTPARQVIVTEGLMPLVVAAMETHPELATLQVRNAIFVPFAYQFHTKHTKPIIFTKTGSGQTYGKLQRKDGVSHRERGCGR